jgi:hypothetical protein
MTRTTLCSTSALVILVAAVGSGCTQTPSEAKTEPAQASAATAETPRPVLDPPIYELNDATYIRWPLPAGAERYADLQGPSMMPSVNTLVAISERSRKDGNQWWGRVTGTPYHEEAQKFVAERFRAAGLETRTQTFELEPSWYPKSWSVSATAGSKALALKTAHPVLRSVGTSKDGIEADAVYVGLGSKAEFLNREVKGKAVFIYSIPQPSALRHSAAIEGAMGRAHEAGAAAVFMVLGIPGNVTTQLWGTGGESQKPTPVPTFSLGLDDGLAVRQLIEAGSQVRIKVQMDTETRQGVKPTAVFGVLPGSTDENVLVLAHTDALFQGAVDNASGVAVMLGLAEHFSRVPRAERQRRMTFLAPVGHHVTNDVSLVWMREQMKEFWPKTALIINCEHVTTTSMYRFDRALVRANSATGHRFWVGGGTRRVPDIFFKAFMEFGVALYEAPQIRPTGDLSPLRELAPGIEVIESNEFYHSDMDVNTVPAAGLEGIARAYARIIDEVNRLPLSELRAAPTTATASR